MDDIGCKALAKALRHVPQLKMLILPCARLAAAALSALGIQSSAFGVGTSAVGVPVAQRADLSGRLRPPSRRFLPFLPRSCLRACVCPVRPIPILRVNRCDTEFKAFARAARRMPQLVVTTGYHFNHSEF
jgi:hypothetical protein